MTNFRAELSGKEKMARNASGPDSNATFCSLNEEGEKKAIQQEKLEKFNEQVNEMQQRFQSYVDAIHEAGKKLAADMNKVEIMPLTSYVLISPFEVNPFQVVKTNKFGLITDLGGLTPQYKSEETGKMEEEKPYVKVGTVVETGTECKFLQPGDVVFYNIASEVMVPFYKFGFVIVAEQRIIAVVNEGLSKRKEDILNGNAHSDGFKG